MLKTLVICVAVLLASTAAFSAGEKTTGKENAQYMNVLCYHQFVNGNAFGKKDTYKISLPEFEKQLEFLRDNGYNVISMDDFLQFLDGKKKLPEKAVMITIDDGYESIYTGAYPLLLKYKYPATIFVYYKFIRPDERSHESALTVAQILEMKKSGLISVGSHSYTHDGPLTSRHKIKTDADYLAFLKREIITAKSSIEKMLGIQLETMAYPFGAYSTESNEFVKKAGFKAGFSVVPSYNTAATDRFSLRRTIIYNSTNVARLKKILEKKPVAVVSVEPADGAVIDKPVLRLSAVIQDDSMLNTATVHLRIGDTEYKNSDYDPASKTLTHNYVKAVKNGLYLVSVQARGLDGGNYEYAWMFMAGKKTGEKALAAALNSVKNGQGDSDDKK
jgi:peptidoglycan/xylan/chitin deacetylase (PgdA/CDA1 family)